MLAFLVSSKGRRRLLTALWVERAQGTASQLAKRCRVSFTTAYRELQSMKRWDLVRTSSSVDGELFAANEDHPQASLLAALAVPVPPRRVDPELGEVRAQLAQAGAPLRAELPAAPPADTPEATEALALDGLQAAQRDPEIARVLPVFLYQQRQRGLDLDRLATRAHARGLRHRLGFFLAITARLTGDAALARRARTLRDRRVKNQALFLTSSSSRTFKAWALARAWGFRLRANFEWFESLFRKFVSLPAVQPSAI